MVGERDCAKRGARKVAMQLSIYEIGGVRIAAGDHARAVGYATETITTTDGAFLLF